MHPTAPLLVTLSKLEKPTVSNLVSILPAFLLRILEGFSAALEYFVPESCRNDPDQARRARLIAHFGVQGTLFGAAYAMFYACIDHFTGAEVILVCSAVFAAVPWILKRTGQIGLAGHLVIGTMAAGFTQLTLIEGGIHCHAVAWLASVPLCALLILGLRPAAIWSAVCFLAGTSIAIGTLCGVELEPLYDPRWRNLIDAAGNLGIILFLFTLGLVFEVQRFVAFQRMGESMDDLAGSNEELAQLNNEKTDFLGMAAHDLRNPLTAIIGFADLLQMEHTGDAAKAGREISKAGRRMLELITDLLDANAIEAGLYASQVEPHDLRSLVKTAMLNHVSAAQRKQSALHLLDGGPCWAQADCKATLQVIDNLVSNALKYSPPASTITLGVRETRSGVEFFVRDQGPGISEADKAKLFHKHTKLSARPTAGESSVGLGLSIVKKLAEAMGGSVFCESTPGKGATFILRLQPVPKEFVKGQVTGPRSEIPEPVYAISGPAHPMDFEIAPR